RRTLGRPKALLGARRVPREGGILRDQNIGMPIARYVNKAQIRIFPGHVRSRCKSGKSRPAALCGPLIESGQRRVKLDKIEQPVAREVQQLLPSTTQGRN